MDRWFEGELEPATGTQCELRSRSGLALAVKVVSEVQEFPVEEVNAETLKKAIRLVDGLQPGIGGVSLTKLETAANGIPRAT